MFNTSDSSAGKTGSRETTPGHVILCSQSPEVMVVRVERKIDAQRLILTMPFPKSISVLTFSLTLISNIYVVVSGDELNPTVLAPADKLEGFASLNSPAAVSNSTVFKVARNSIFTINLLSSLSEDQEISVYCRNLLEIFGQRYAASINCLVPAARPVKICQNCFSAYDNVRDIYMNISSDQVGCDKTSCFSLLAERPPFFRNSSSLAGVR